MVKKIFLITILALSLIIFVRPLFLDNYPDFNSYYYSSYATFNNGHPYTGFLYKENAFSRFNYPPQALIFFSIFSHFSISLAGKLFTVFSIIAFFLSIIILFKIGKIKYNSVTSIILLIFVLNFFPEKFTLGMGQVNNYIFLFLVLFLYFYKKKMNIFSGIILAIASAIKISPFFYIVFPFIKKDWVTLKSFIFTSFLLFIPATIFIKTFIIIHFFKHTLPSLSIDAPSDYYNQSLAGFLARIIQDNDLRISIQISILFFIVSSSIYIIWVNKDNQHTNTQAINLLITLSLIISGISWQHHFVWALIPLFFTYLQVKKLKFRYIYNMLIFLSYLLIAINLKNPTIYSIFLRSHALYGIAILFILQVHLLLLTPLNLVIFDKYNDIS